MTDEDRSQKDARYLALQATRSDYTVAQAEAFLREFEALPEATANRQQMVDEARVVLVYRLRRDERALGWPESPSACKLCQILGFQGGKLQLHGPLRMLAERAAKGESIRLREVCPEHHTLEAVSGQPTVFWRGPRSEWLGALYRAQGWEP